MSKATPAPDPGASAEDAKAAAQDTVAAAWEEYKQSKSSASRDVLILHYSPLVKYVAGRVAVGLPANIDQSDLMSYGIFGLMDAIGMMK